MFLYFTIKDRTKFGCYSNQITAYFQLLAKALKIMGGSEHYGLGSALFPPLTHSLVTVPKDKMVLEHSLVQYR